MPLIALLYLATFLYLGTVIWVLLADLVWGWASMIFALGRKSARWNPWNRF